ncbi:Gly-Xaa carboxypeptidase [Dionaea muscipula]
MIPPPTNPAPIRHFSSLGNGTPPPPPPPPCSFISSLHCSPLLLFQHQIMKHAQAHPPPSSILHPVSLLFKPQPPSIHQLPMNTSKIVQPYPVMILSLPYNSSSPILWTVIETTKRNKVGWTTLCSRSNAVAMPSTAQENSCCGLLHNELNSTSWHCLVEDDDVHQLQLPPKRSSRRSSDEIEERVEMIRSMLRSIGDGEISVSAYDTAWVALVQDINEGDEPQFPACLEWIAGNQLPDGSWGESCIFSAHDRIINTLACLIALRSWNIHPHLQEKGMRFVKENMNKLGEENGEHMPIGFEVAFPAMIEKARSLGMDFSVPDKCPILHEIYAKRRIKLTRIPWDIMHRVPTTLLHSLEGMGGLDWEKLLKLQSEDGSFLFSPSSTACALMQTRDVKCLKYLEKAVQRFKGGVPNVYPVDLFEHIWVVDRLQRLGISRYFQAQIEELIDYVYRYWTERGICWARNSEIQDIDDTAMGFRLLRLHGYDVSANVFENFKKDGEFFCFAGQSTQAVTGMYNLYRASQLQFPRGEDILKEARSFSSKFLKEKQASNHVLDKWMITKDLPGEVQYSLEIPWYASLPRIENRSYIDQYGGIDDVWIGKTLYRMPLVNNNIYLELAKLDFNHCQSLHILEWDGVQSWYAEHKLGQFGLSQTSLLRAYFLAASNIFEPENSTQRLAWAKTTALIETITSYFSQLREGTSREHRRAFTQEFHMRSLKVHGHTSSHAHIANRLKELQNSKSGLAIGPMSPLLVTINQLSFEVLTAHGGEIRLQLHKAWEKWLRTWEPKADRFIWEAGLITTTIQLCSSKNRIFEEMVYHPQYQCLLNITNKICHHLGHLQHQKVQHAHNSNMGVYEIEAESSMQKLVELVMRKYSYGIHEDTKQTFLTVAKSFYYAAYCRPKTMNNHISKVLFEKVD